MAQSTRHSRWEVGIDFGFSIIINIGTQALVLKTFTPSRGITFTMAFLTLALLRRYTLRRMFNRLVRPGHGQSVGMSLLESWTDTMVAIAMAFGLVAIWYPNEPLLRVSVLVVVSYIQTMLRRFALRRLFEWLYMPQHS